LYNKDELKQRLEIEDIITILIALGLDREEIEERGKGLVLPTICHNPLNEEKSQKLYYYPEQRLFYCYTECSTSFDIYELVMKVYGLNYTSLSFVEAVNYVASFVESDEFVILDSPKQTLPEWEWLKKYKKQEENKNVVLPEYSTNVLDVFMKAYHRSWINEGIKVEEMKRFDIRYYLDQNKVIIPHRDINGRLVGVRGRALNESELSLGFKYMPVRVEGRFYTHPLSFNLYGLYENKKQIKELKRVFIFEGEKSVLKFGSFFGEENNCAVAVCGSNFSTFQRDLLIKNFQLQEVVFCMDKEYTSLRDPNSDKYYEKLQEMAKKLSPYVNTSFIFDMENRLEEKDSPIDKGREIFQELYNRRIRVS
jgi:hypothetical protein